MSPGVTFERVYNELKRMLTEGELPPGMPIEPAIIGRQISSSITPVRDALHRLTGERLVEAPNHNGFRVPLPTEAALRDLYRWNGQLLGLAVKSIRTGMPDIAVITVPNVHIAVATAEFFLRIAQESRSGEQADAVARLNARLGPYRLREKGLLEGLQAELEHLSAAGGSPARLAKGITAYHRRRIKAVPDILRYGG